MEIRINETNREAMESYLRGESFEGEELFGAIKKDDGYLFRLLAPQADRVYLLGDFNDWTPEPMCKNSKYGYFHLFRKAKLGDYYKFLVEKDGVKTFHTDPFAKAMDRPPEFAAKITDDSYKFSDNDRMERRDLGFSKPINIYEIHLGSRLNYGGDFNLLNIVDRLISYLKKMGYNYLEIMPVTEHPYYPSRGYQVSGFFAFSSRYGSARDFKTFVDLLHQEGIGVILDLVPLHFARDSYGLSCFDGTFLYESSDPSKRESGRGSINFDYSKAVVKSFTKSFFAYRIKNFHLDGVRMDAISYMLYPGGDESSMPNFTNICFLKELNQGLFERFPTVFKVAEDSSSFPKVTGKVQDGGLGFDYKWDLGFMNDSLSYFEADSLYRRDLHEKITFSMFYFYHENFLLPFSHDEVVHLKKPMIRKMAGDYDSQFKELMALFTYQMTHPGKKLSFMGNELASFDEWDENKSLYWDILKFPRHAGFQKFMTNLNRLYLKSPALFERDYREDGFLWKVVDDRDTSVFAFERRTESQRLLVVLNFTNTYKKAYQIPYDEALSFKEILNSLSKDFIFPKEEREDIKIEEGEALSLDLREYEAVIFEILKD